MIRLAVVLTGRNYDWADALPSEITLPEGASLSDALEALQQAMPADKQLPATCLVAVSGTHRGTLAAHEPCSLSSGDELMLISPVAGG